MNALRFAAALGLLAGSWAVVVPVEEQLPCDSPDAEAVALAAQDYLNNQQTHMYKYALNQIDDIKVIHKPTGDDIYLLEVDLLETNCYLLDPTPVANCTVRPKLLTSVEGDCDFVLTKAGGALTVTAFKCKTEESTEDFCLGCPMLLPLNHTGALDFVTASLDAFNNQTANITFTLSEVGRLATQVVSAGPIFVTEYAIVEANCTNGNCVPLTDNAAQRGFCKASGSGLGAMVDCKIFPMPMLPLVDAAAVPVAPQPPINVHTDILSTKHGLRHHKLTALHDPGLSGLLSAESAESSEVVPVFVPATASPAAADASPAAADASPAAAEPAVTDAPAAIVKRQAPVLDAPIHLPAGSAIPISLVPLCPGRVRHF